jgi:hypothetical protein
MGSQAWRDAAGLHMFRQEPYCRLHHGWLRGFITFASRGDQSETTIESKCHTFSVDYTEYCGQISVGCGIRGIEQMLTNDERAIDPTTNQGVDNNPSC